MDSSDRVIKSGAIRKGAAALGAWLCQSATPHGRLVTFSALAPVFLFLATIILAYWYLRNQAFAQEHWVAVALSVLIACSMLFGVWRRVGRRLQVQSALASEANFRRAMEDSMLTGMRALDKDGRILYVNRAFSTMTGFSEADLIGRMPPQPYWPPDRIEECSQLLDEQLQGLTPASGIESKVMRKDGSLFDARFYVSPLINPKGQHIGWMTSMTDITEAKRIRDELSASYERFTTVLEGLDAAVAVLSVQEGELLFANRFYRLWFGADTLNQGLLTTADLGIPSIKKLDLTREITGASSDSREVFIEPIQKWFDLRTRYLQWTDGRVAQLLIATDISERRNAETNAAIQAEKAMAVSRLVTMGEMASSVAHELNQPLAAITNYCNGIVTRVNNDAINKEELIAALEKTSAQARRAGQIIRRIRALVKRSEPQRVPAQAQSIVEDAVELASIELRRRKITIRTEIEQGLPILSVDPILIEQVVLNLLRNAADAVDGEGLPPERRSIAMRVAQGSNSEEGDVIEFSVTDRGPGLKDEVIARMYEAFFSTKANGLGIGLSLCRSIIESHHGRINAQNLYNGEEAVGCRFSFTLPVDISASAATPVQLNR